MSKQDKDKTKAKVTEKVKRKDDPDVLFVPESDQAMVQAIQQARETVNTFIEALLNPTPLQHSFSVKVMLQDEQGTEHIWLSEVTYQAATFIGKIGNNPVVVKNYTMGQEVKVAAAEISDWMFLENRVLKGGYTIRLLRNTMSEEEKAQFDQQVGFIFEEEEQPASAAEAIPLKDVEANLHTPQGALLSLENAYDQQDFEAAVACKDFEIEAALILKDKVQHLAEEEVQPILKKTAEMLLLSFQKVFQEGGFPSFENVDRVYHVQYMNESVALITEEQTFEDGQQRTDTINAVYTKRGWKILAPLE
ncbi:MAG: YegJ family protein [Thermonemataceae bacterium]